jgi:hypothetical protein
VSLANSVWITAAHVVLFDSYIANHPQEAAMMTSMPLPDSPRLMMALMGPVIGVLSGIVLGPFFGRRPQTGRLASEAASPEPLRRRLGVQGSARKHRRT